VRVERGVSVSTVTALNKELRKTKGGKDSKEKQSLVSLVYSVTLPELHLSVEFIQVCSMSSRRYDLSAASNPRMVAPACVYAVAVGI
jgi:hypothetical protein